MKRVKQSIKALRPIWHLLNPKPWTMTGNIAFNRNKRKRFQALAMHLDDDDFKSFLVVVGFVEVNWALFESQMDRWVQIAFHEIKFRHGGNEAPTAYGRKSSWLRKAFTHLHLRQYRDRAIKMLDKSDELSTTRHDLTHGVITGIKPVDLYNFSLVNRKLLRNGMNEHKEIMFDVRDFPKLSKELADLGADAIRLTDDLAKKFL